MNRLNDLMQFDHVIKVDADHNVTDAPPDIWGPEVYDDRIEQEGGWTLMYGWSYQFRYAGPEMHPSETIGGDLEKAILHTPGYYVATVICDPDSDETSGWVVAFKELEEDES